MQFWDNAGIDPSLPDISGVEYLLEMMSPDQLGWCEYDSAGGSRAISWQEIQSFSQQSGQDLEPWEARQLRAMSVAFVHSKNKGREPMTVSPVFIDDPDNDPGKAAERKKISDTLKASMSAIAKKA